MNATFTLLEMRRITRDWSAMFFTAGLPAFFYLIFGATVDAKGQDIGNGNVAMYVMISMAAYGAVTATTSIGGNAAVERVQGWGRQLGLTPLADSSYIAMKAVIAMTVAAVPVLITYLLGAATGARGSASAWAVSALLTLAGSAVFALYGLVIGTAFRSEASVGAAAGTLVIFAFLGNLFIPLSGALLTFAKFTPLYGYAALARYPLTEGYLPDGTQDPLWLPIANVVVWALVFGGLATWFVRRGRERQ
ncbi:ABC transporter permease [Intrasporangium flavum]|uniref:ABC transporter permease n=1 Tax=Intrasporangium flavum TaxID=1428657 RepID=UPI00096F203B|nr:ABC transporter permease [Intrasporangium flavum]